MTKRQWEVGEVAPVRVRARGGTEEETRGEVVIEDLTGVLSRMAVRSGVNGPQSPITQYILLQGAKRLNEGMVSDARSIELNESAPRVLSALVGHEPFVETTLNLSVHQMRRRWPAAADWYADLIAYIVRSSARGVIDVPDEEMAQLMEQSLGVLVHRICQVRFEELSTSDFFGLSLAVRAMWPTYPPVQESVREEEQALLKDWAPLFGLLSDHYGLMIRDDVEVGELYWAFESFHLLESERVKINGDSVLFEGSSPDLGIPQRPYAARLILVLLAGAVVDVESGEPLTPAELSARMPRRPVTEPPAIRNRRS